MRSLLLAALGLASSVCAIFAGAAIAQAPAVMDAAQVDIMPDQEPITPLPPPPDADPRKLALGERLFADTRMSADGTLSCESCHDIHSNGAGGHPARAGSKPPFKPPFDTLTIFNAALNFRLDWQGNFRDLAAQAEASLENPQYMRTSPGEVALQLNHDPGLVAQFKAAYGHAPDRENVLDALVTFERSLLTPGSRFDRWLGGEASALSADELEGYRLFKSFGCSSCHQGRNVGGNLFERQGVFHPLVQGPPETVRVPSLRNVAATAPYFHDGSAGTLQDAVRRMAKAQLDRTLSDAQIELIVGFLRTLTGNYRGTPVTGAPT